jgi:uncharacterized protein YukE
MLIRANFGLLQDTADQIKRAFASIDKEMSDFHTSVTGVVGGDWGDGAGGRFGEVAQAHKAMSDAQQTMLNAIQHAIEQTRIEMEHALSSAMARMQA